MFKSVNIFIVRILLNHFIKKKKHFNRVFIKYLFINFYLDCIYFKICIRIII